MDTRMDDAGLAAHAAGGSNEAFAELYDRHGERMFDFALRTVRDTSTAEDVVQNTFIKAWGSLRRGSKPEHVRAWLFAIARNEAIDEIRRRGRQASPMSDDQVDALKSVPPDETRQADPELVLRDQELIDLVWESAEALNEKAYALLDMHLRQELSADEIAGSLGVSSDNVHKKLSRLRRSLEEAVASQLLRRHRGECEIMDELVAGLAGKALTPSGRRAISKHVRSCDTCEERRRRLTAPASVFASFTPVPLALTAKADLFARVDAGLQTASATRVPPGPAGRARNWWWIATPRARAVLAIIGATVAGLILAAVVAVTARGDGEAVRDPSDAVSTTHVIGESSADREVTIAWTALDDVAGYSIDWDVRADTLPDTVTDLGGGATEAISPALDDGSWYFHLRTQSSAGDWTATIHLGPFVISETAEGRAGSPDDGTDGEGAVDVAVDEVDGRGDGDGDENDVVGDEPTPVVATTVGDCGIFGGEDQEPTPEVTFPTLTVENDGQSVIIRFPTHDQLANGSLWSDRHTGPGDRYQHGLIVQFSTATGAPVALVTLDFSRLEPESTTTFEVVDIDTFEPFDPASGPVAGEVTLLEDGGFEIAPIAAPDDWRMVSFQASVFLDDANGARSCTARLGPGDVASDSLEDFFALLLADPSGGSNYLEWTVDWI